MAAGLTTLNLISSPGFYKQLEDKANALLQGLQDAANRHDISFTTNRAGGMFGLFFSEAENISYFSQVIACNQEQFKTFFHAMLQEGIYLAPSAFEAGFISAAHDTEEIEKTIEAAGSAFSQL